MAESSDNTNYFRGYYDQSPGITDVGSYQVSGYPWVTGSVILDGQEHEINFPSVTKAIYIQNKTLAGQGNTDILVHFDTGINSGVDIWSNQPIRRQVQKNIHQPWKRRRQPSDL